MDPRNLLRHPDSRLFCLDTFEGGAEHGTAQATGLYDRSRANLAEAGVAGRAEALRGPSFDGPLRPIADGIEVDLVDLDGCTRRRTC